METPFVRNIAMWHQRMGKSADEIASEQHLPLGEVYSALAYYFNHKLEIDQFMDEGRSSAPSEPNPMAEAFLHGVGSVLEFFPSPGRFDGWRLAHEISITEWPSAVRKIQITVTYLGQIFGLIIGKRAIISGALTVYHGSQWAGGFIGGGGVIGLVSVFVLGRKKAN